MNATNWLAQRLTDEHRRDLERAAAKSRQVQEARKAYEPRHLRRLLSNLRSEA